MAQKRYYTVKTKRVLIKQRKKLSLFEIVKQLHEYTSVIDINQTRSYREEIILLSCLQFIVNKLKKKHALKKSQIQKDRDEHSTEVKFTADKATNTALNKHIRFESSSSESSRSHSPSRSRSKRSEDEREAQVGVNENERIENMKNTYEKHIERLHDKIRQQCNEIKEYSRQQHKGMTNHERNTVFVTSTIFMAIVTSFWLYFVIYSFVSEEQGNMIFSNILFVQIMFIVLSVRCM